MRLPGSDALIAELPAGWDQTSHCHTASRSTDGLDALYVHGVRSSYGRKSCRPVCKAQTGLKSKFARETLWKPHNPRDNSEITRIDCLTRWLLCVRHRITHFIEQPLWWANTDQILTATAQLVNLGNGRQPAQWYCQVWSVGCVSRMASESALVGWRAVVAVDPRVWFITTLACG